MSLRPPRTTSHLPLRLRGLALQTPRSFARPSSSAPRYLLHRHRTQFHPAAKPPPYIFQSAVNWTSVVLFAAVGAAIGVGSGIYQGFTSSKDAAPIVTEPHADLTEEDMSTTTLPPGRPGNLTPEEEAKLRELWHLALQVFGVIEPSQASSPNGRSPALSRTASVDVSTPDKKKKNRLSFMKRKKDEPEPVESVQSSPSLNSSISDVLNNMKEDKHGTLSAFKAAIADLTPTELRNSFWSMVKHDHPDALLLRFLRARKWDVQAAGVMAMAALHWRIVDSKVDEDVMYNGEQGLLDYATDDDPAKAKEGRDFMAQLRLGKSFLHGFDKEGRPICYVRVRLHKPGEQSESSLERFTVYTIETARLFLQPPVDTATIIFDMTDFGLSNMDYAPVKFMIKCFEANYPESLGCILVHKAPWVFQGVWRVIKGWLDPVVASKIRFTNNYNDLAEVVEPSKIIKELGGSNPWSYQYIEPRAEENAVMKDTAARQTLESDRENLAKGYEAVVQQWIASTPTPPASKPGTAQAPPLKTPAPVAASLRTKRDQLAAELKKNYWALDPYVRARSLYDRTGELVGEGAAPKRVERTPDVEGLVRKISATHLVPSGAGNSPRLSVDSTTQSFHTTREDWEQD